MDVHQQAINQINQQHSKELIIEAKLEKLAVDAGDLLAVTIPNSAKYDDAIKLLQTVRNLRPDIFIIAMREDWNLSILDDDELLHAGLMRIK